MDIGSLGLGARPVYGSYAVAGTQSPPTQTIGDHVKSEFLEYAQKTVAEKIEEAILKEMGLTKEDIEAMAPEERDAVMEKIAERMKEKMREQIENEQGILVSGSFADMVA